MTIPSYTYDLPSRTQMEETFNVNAENWVSWFTSEAAPAINDAISVINDLLPGIIVYEPVGAWGALTTYTYLDVVAGSDGYTYRSIAAGENFGNDPVTDGGTHWVLVGQPVMASSAEALAGLSSILSMSPASLSYVLGQKTASIADALAGQESSKFLTPATEAPLRPFRNMQRFTTSGSWSWPSTTGKVYAIVKGGGAMGKGGPSTGQLGVGGGEGGTVEGFIPKPPTGVTLTVTIGAGGTGNGGAGGASRVDGGGSYYISADGGSWSTDTYPKSCGGGGSIGGACTGFVRSGISPGTQVGNGTRDGNSNVYGTPVGGGSSNGTDIAFGSGGSGYLYGNSVPNDAGSGLVILMW